MAGTGAGNAAVKKMIDFIEGVVPKAMNCRRVFATAFSPSPSPCP